MKRTEYFRKYREANREKIATYMREWRAQNHDKCRGYWQKQNSAERMQEWRVKNREHVREVEAKRRANPNVRLRRSLNTRFYNALKGRSKSARTLQLIGCTIEYLWLYLESRFEEGMTRENYGKVWEVDHIIPCALFDLTKEDHQRRCFFFGNLQPLFVKENRSKGAKVKQLTMEGKQAIWM